MSTIGPLFRPPAPPPEPEPPPRPVIPTQQGRLWPWAVGSVLLHLILFAVAAGIFFDKQPKKAEQPPPPAPYEMVYVPPPRNRRPPPLPKPKAAPAPSPDQPPPQPQPQAPPPPPEPQQPPPPPPPRQLGLFTPPPPKTEVKPDDEANALPTEKPKEGKADPTDTKAGAQEQAPTPQVAEAPKEATPTEASPKPIEPLTPDGTRAVASQEEEAARIFGRSRRSAGDAGSGDPISVRPFSSPFQSSEPCQPVPRAPRDANGKAPLGVAVGRILREDSGEPLAGANLQMVGTPYTTFTDENGEYRFVYDMSLIEDCRTQYVRVTAPGYQSRMLVLVVGERVRSEDVPLRRR